MNGIGELHCIGTCSALIEVSTWYLHKERGEIVKMVCRTHKYPPKVAARMRQPKAGTRVGTWVPTPS